MELDAQGNAIAAYVQGGLGREHAYVAFEDAPPR